MSNYVVYVGDGFGGNFTYGKKYRVLSNLHTTSSYTYINVLDDLGESQIVPIDVEKDIEYFITIDEWRDRLINNIIK